MVTDTDSRIALMHELCDIKSKYNYPGPMVSIDRITECFQHAGFYTDDMIIGTTECFKGMLDDKLRRYRKIAPSLEKNLMRIVKNNSKSSLIYRGFTDRDLRRHEYEHMGFDLYAIETIHWICNATGWTKQQLEIMISDEGDCDFIESWVPPSDAF